jgi:hypothetical protein
MKYLLSILKRTSLGRIQYYRLLSSSGNNYNQLQTTCDPQSDVYKVFLFSTFRSLMQKQSIILE